MNTYPSYKDSGIEWIGEIPSGWSSSKFKYISSLFTGNSLNQNQKEQYESDDISHIPYVSSKDINVDYQTVNYNNGLRIPTTDNPLKVCKTNGFLLCVEGGSSGRKMTFLNEDVCFVNKLCCFESSQNTKYQYYFIQTSNFQSKFKISLTGLIGGVSISTLRNFEIPLPPLQEQQQISDYLDYKTSKIDTLIEKTQQKIELLKEQRTSLINTTVTKGLNPNVEMKNSGVEWIGEIPSGWSVVSLKYLFKIIKRISGELGYDVLSVTQKGLKVKDLDNFQGQHSMDYSKYQLVYNGDFVMNHMDLLTGYVDLSNKTGVTSPDYRVFSRINHNTNNKYFLYIFQLSYTRRIFYKFGRGVSNLGRWRLPSVEWENFKVPVPDTDNQQEIVDYLDQETSKIDKLVDIESKRIDLLKEYRQSLISDVVTGKVDVRDEVLV